MSLTPTRVVPEVAHVSVGRMILLGLVAGLIAGALSGVVAFVTGEGLIDQAIALESAGHEDEHSLEELVSRDGQRWGLFLATALTGAAIGMTIAVVVLPQIRRDPQRATQKILLAAGAAWFSFSAVPFIMTPPDPPSIGSPETITLRTVTWAIAVLAGALVIVVYRVVAGGFRPATFVRGVLAVLAGVAVLAIVGVLLPRAGNDYTGFPADLLWSFRLSSAATQLALWATLAVALRGLVVAALRRR